MVLTQITNETILSKTIGLGVDYYMLKPVEPTLVCRRLREMLDSYGFPGDDTPIIRGSALLALESDSTDPNDPVYAPIKELLDAIDTYIPLPERETDKPFMMPTYS